jgi:nucleoside-diphosphate-sugar epimerase
MGAVRRGHRDVKVFVTGGTGLVGRHVVRALRARGEVVRALARSPAAASRLAAEGAEPVAGAVTDGTAVARGAAGCDVIVHAAATVLGSGRWPRWHAVNVRGTELVAEAAAQGRARLVHLSSVAVYGRRTTYDGGAGSVDEDFGLDRPMSARDPYARSKREAEQALWSLADRSALRAVALRPCVIYGEGDRHFAPRVARVIRRGFAPLIGDGNNLLSVVYAGNVAAAVLAALDHPEATGPFNVTNDGGITLREFIRHFAAGLGVPAPRWVRIPYGLARGAARFWDATAGALPGPVRLLSLATSVQFLASANPYTSARAVRELGWRPAVAPADAVERTARSLQAGADARP